MLTLWRLVGCALRLRCPVCGTGRLFRSYFTPNERCPHCGFLIARGNEYGHEGYFTGAMAINLVITGVVPLVVLSILAMTTALTAMQLVIAGVVWTVLFPLLFYPYACALWIVVDHLSNPPPPAELAGEQTARPVASPLAARRERARRRHEP
jgi:uncharacterized protein (DUF983 family)